MCYNPNQTGKVVIVLRNRILQDIPFEEPEELDTLLEFADLVREKLQLKQERELSELIRFTIRHGHYEAFYWALGILEEAYGSDDAMQDMRLELGRSIPDYREFISRLQVDFNAVGNDVLTVPDEHGEVQSFFNILRYQTGFPHLQLVTSENFDARDNDYIQYMLLCRAN